MSDADARDDLRRLLKQGVKLATLRVLRVECEHDCALLDVLRVNGHHLLYVRATLGDAPEDGEHPQWTLRGDGHGLFDFDDADDETVAEVSTSCCARSCNARWIRHVMKNGERRTVLHADEGIL